jgi:hypothetical protein
MKKKRITLFPERKLTKNELKSICFIATLILAAIVVLAKVESPIVWTFLGAAIGALFGQEDEKD